ncbi:glycosyltransferase family 4 protein [Mesonia sp. HuA40]|uniref:glycosyltransferase family 4 protein n=1 Tax=Mesonia sp. HuA40 TaxID=2602761 RepID=UPI0011C9449F|nr:glycosyltransferase family 4 protein [Mesonia sp. HuA40]TXK74296.1 glycosyltransferase family 4 protein [Mesonia sp. HuA40]
MNTKTIYVLHKNGADNHYIGLKQLLQENDIEIKFREFSIMGKLFKSLIKGKPKLFKKQIINLIFVAKLLVSKNKKIVLGIAPFDDKLSRLLPLLKKHNVYYHTSWTCWDKTFNPKQPKNKKTYHAWSWFLKHKTKHIFCVTQTAKNSLLANYQIKPEKISVVYHAVNEAFFTDFKTEKKQNSFVYVGRLVQEKGIVEVLDFFKKNTAVQLTIIGRGKLESLVREAAESTENISYVGSVSDKAKLAQILSNQKYLILNSKKTNKWEELFGMVIIEAMAQGLIPISSNHSGPSEIIKKEIGFVYPEGKLESTLLSVIKENPNSKKSALAKKEAHLFNLQNISKKWKPILA